MYRETAGTGGRDIASYKSKNRDTPRGEKRGKLETTRYKQVGREGGDRSRRESKGNAALEPGILRIFATRRRRRLRGQIQDSREILRQVNGERSKFPMEERTGSKNYRAGFAVSFRFYEISSFFH